jgi:hypothetical protein
MDPRPTGSTNAMEKSKEPNMPAFKLKRQRKMKVHNTTTKQNLLKSLVLILQGEEVFPHEA